MEKILFAIDATDLDMKALNFACDIADLTNSKLTGVFLENLPADEKLVLKRMQGSIFFDWEIDPDSVEYRHKQGIIEKNISLFEEVCKMKSVAHSIHRDEGVPAGEIISETRFADLLIVNAATVLNDDNGGVPTRFVKQLLKDSECPVIIAPQNFEAIDEIVFTYNGSKSSVFAIKQFTYLFPELAEKKTIIVKVSEKEGWDHGEKFHFKEWLQHNYSSVGFEELKGDADDQLFDFLLKRKNAFIVMGAYGRSGLSRFLKPSLADLFIKTITQPLFIAHC